MKQTMRVIAGTHRRRQLKSVPTETTRSTRDRVKESLFNMLTPLEQYEHCLDLFAGSGALGIEALSRGAKQAVFVENQSTAFGVLKENVLDLDLATRSQLIQTDALAYCQHEDTAFDLILLDPPYHSHLLNRVLEVVCKRNILAKQGLIVVLSEREHAFHLPPCLTEVKRRHIGITTVTLLKGANL